MSVLEERRTALLAEAADGVEAGSQATPALVTAYLRHVPSEDLVERQADDLRGVVLSHVALARQRRPGETLVAGFTPRVESHGWTTGTTVLQVVTDDMPFIVDSVTAELDRQGQEIKLLIHPQLDVVRDDEGVMTGLGEGGTGESWVHLEVSRAADHEAVEHLVTRLRAVLGDVVDAVEDWGPMRNRALEIAAGLIDHPQAMPEEERHRVRRLLEWLADDHFVFLGYRQYRYAPGEGGGLLEQIPGTGLGLMRRDRGTPHRRLAGIVARKADERHLLILTKANARSTVHRDAHLDYVGVKTYDADGQIDGEHRFIGLFTSNVYHASVQAIPFVAEKVREVLRRSGFDASSHSGKRLLSVMERYPRDELFQTDVDHLSKVAMRVVGSPYNRQTQLFVRPDLYGRFTSCLVLLPRERYNTTVRLRMQDILMSAFAGSDAEYTARIDDSPVALVHYIIRRAADAPDRTVDLDHVQDWLQAAVRTWDSDWEAAMVAEFGESDAARLVARWGTGLDEAYKAMHRPRVAAVDVRHLERLTAGGLLALLHQDLEVHAGERRLRLYSDRSLELTEVLPLLLDFGMKVTDERTHRVIASDGTVRHVFDFGVNADTEEFWSPTPGAEEAGVLLGFEAVWDGRAESDRFNMLIGLVGLTWQQVVALRMVAAYLRQTTHYSPQSLESSLVENPAVARLLVDVFEARFQPGDDDGRPGREHAATEAVVAALADVPKLDHDRIIRAFLDVVLATDRTNFYAPGVLDTHTGTPRAAVLKLDSRRVPHLPAPTPEVESWVYSPRIEGVHLRFGRIARGGLRWSDRRDDLRTEVLGLVKAQMVKNAVIVPAGAKGGFFPKQLPDPQVDRAAWLAHGRACYREFIEALLSVSDSRSDDDTVHPEAVVRHDGDDTYLVVAADKGTASFSDLANEVSLEHDFWLGDAFASGGSAGYDHKDMGITARGAWESVKRHFLELGIDPGTDEITAVGIGDMSGDVFGNGLLRSPHVKLVGAFDHRHVFVDPHPDPAAGFAERQRLFELPYSSWADYDPALISEGGGVFPRDAKSIPVTPQMREALGLGDAEAVTPNELIRGVLTAPVDLLWNGGIGTYVKASRESHSRIGDRSNDSIRVDGAQLRCRVVGEGGNLGASQRGRIEAAQHGVHINTDAIDNSGGVDCSDHEVNIKILLHQVMADGQMTLKQRNDLLRSMTDDVAHSVLRTNYEQNVLLANARYLGDSMLASHERLIQWLEEHRGLDRSLEALPSTAEIQRRAKDGRGLTSPEFSVLVAYVKLALKDELLASGLPDDPWFEDEVVAYFPAALREYRDAAARHPLRREIIATRVANAVVNRGGITFAYRAADETGASLAEVAGAFVVAAQAFDMAGFVADVEELDGVLPTATQSELYLEFRRLMDRSVRFLLGRHPALGTISDEVERYREPIQRLRAEVRSLYGPASLGHFDAETRRLEDLGIPHEVARRAASLLDGVAFFGVVDLARQLGWDPALVTRGYLHLTEMIGFGSLQDMLSTLPDEVRWDAIAKSAFRQDLYRIALTLTGEALTEYPDADAAARIRHWADAHAPDLQSLEKLVLELREASDLGLGHFWVVQRELVRLTRDG